MNPRIDEIKRQLRQLEELAASGALPADQAAASRSTLEQELLALVLQSGDASAPPAAPAAPRPSRRLLAAIAGFVVVVAVAGYAVYGTPGAWKGVPVAGGEGDGGHGSAMAQIEAMVAKLEQRLKDSPEDAEGWSMLGRSYSAMGRYPEAVKAFQRVIDMTPKDAQAYADLADATAMAAGRKLAGEPAALIAKALELDPKNLKALALAGTIAFDNNDYDKAARLWEAAVAAAEPGSELARNLQGGVAEARSRAGQASPGAAPPAPQAVAGASVAGEVQLAAALKGRVSPEDTVFVFARAVDGPRVPLAILRKQVKDLPLNFTLDDSMAMSPATRLSTAKQVVVGARVSKSGNAMPQPGDLQGFSPPTAVGASGLKIEIAEELK
ncbi:c-type cytochrome biogenesis protein CcmI [uncultured Piscinibacter sp.]|uniref:c-type cytochrome biogenesis protein CcmI n=1 Tax=uncultured Piscinibacter sp. TaxID=1131835 RepID=UPI0026152698|nr:c-type cytochrome biogenesis protein CcmI [uncultured Piscinibacter sp.]